LERRLISGSSPKPDAALFTDLFEDGVYAAASDLRDCAADLMPAERELLRGVARKRELEIATGRMLARPLLEGLGHAGFPLLRDQDRVPIWPKHVVGSISHKEDLCVVAVASGRDRTGLGIDVEPDRPVKPGLERLICLPSEQEWVAAEGPPEIGRRCRAVFSVKEAVYKAFFPRVRKVWGFRDVEVSIDFAQNSFRASLPRSADRAEVDGRILRRQGWILTAVEYR
jgi:4'-phosphopantetheinyl transferase EntD